jgi:hypothetical protein
MDLIGRKFKKPNKTQKTQKTHRAGLFKKTRGFANPDPDP